MSEGRIFIARLVEPREYSLDDLIALNDELIALVKCGVPLERGLLDAAGDFSGRLKRLVESLASRLTQGQSLVQALASGQLHLPAVYAALVQAGVRSGRLSAALEQLAVSTRRIADMRRMVSTALLYPLMTLSVACFLFAWLTPRWIAMLIGTYQLQHLPLDEETQRLLDLMRSAAGFVAWLPLALAAAIAFWWFAAGRAASAQPVVTARWFLWLPGLRRMLRSSASAIYCETLALLIEHDVPLPEALQLAGSTCGDPRLQAASAALGERIARGQNVPANDPQFQRVPALVRWKLAGPQRGRDCASSLRAAASDHRYQTQVMVEWLTVYVPALLVVVIGGGSAAVYTFSVFGPWSALMMSLAKGAGFGF